MSKFLYSVYARDSVVVSSKALCSSIDDVIEMLLQLWVDHFQYREEHNLYEEWDCSQTEFHLWQRMTTDHHNDYIRGLSIYNIATKPDYITLIKVLKETFKIDVELPKEYRE